MEHEMSDTERPDAQTRGALGWLSIAAATAALLWPAIASAGPVVFQAAGSSPVEIVAAVEDFRNFLGADHKVEAPSPTAGARSTGTASRTPSPPQTTCPPTSSTPTPRAASCSSRRAPASRSARKPAAYGAHRVRQPPPAHRELSPPSAPTAVHGAGEPGDGGPFFVPGTTRAATSKRVRRRLHRRGPRRHHRRSSTTTPRHAAVQRFRAAGRRRRDALVPRRRLRLPASAVFLVRITSGDVPIGGAHRRGRRDLVVMDDFIYGEPQPLQP